METRANHVLIGAFTVLVAAALLLFALWAGRYTADVAHRDYEVIFREAVTGLSKGGAVLYNGIQVGEVRRLSLAKNDPRQVVARIRVGADTPIKVDTTAKLALTGLTGVAVIQLSGGSPESPLLEPPPDRDIAIIIAETSALQKLLSSSEDIATTASDVLYRLNRLLRDENTERVARTLDNLQEITAAVAAEREDLGRLVRDAAEAATGLRDTVARAESVFARLERSLDTVDSTLVAELPAMVQSLEVTLRSMESVGRSVNALLLENQDALNSFGSQGLSQMGPAMTELRAMLRDMSRLVQRVEDDPSSFLLGRRQPREFKPE